MSALFCEKKKTKHVCGSVEYVEVTALSSYLGDEETTADDTGAVQQHGRAEEVWCRSKTCCMETKYRLIL